ncbi:MAG: hypothetical protein M0R22_13130 [Dehalococcoidia bacterium]|jgi:hypothetical protein|nr:hypothetical protein [Dehalococcoidia bacterium]
MTPAEDVADLRRKLDEAVRRRDVEAEKADTLLRRVQHLSCEGAETEGWTQSLDRALARATAAESRATRAEKALREIAAIDEGEARCRCVSIARAALAPKATEDEEIECFCQEDGHEPGEVIAEVHCPCCGASLSVQYGDDPGEIGVVGESARPSPPTSSEAEVVARAAFLSYVESGNCPRTSWGMLTETERDVWRRVVRTVKAMDALKDEPKATEAKPPAYECTYGPPTVRISSDDEGAFRRAVRAMDRMDAAEDAAHPAKEGAEVERIARAEMAATSAAREVYGMDGTPMHNVDYRAVKAAARAVVKEGAR